MEDHAPASSASVPPIASAATLLIVDDQPENLSVIGEALRAAGYAVRVANSGEVALAYAARPPMPELILLDVMMPAMDGYEVLRRLRADEATRAIPVIFLTALDDTDDVVRGLRLGAADYLTKPIPPEVLIARVRTQLEAAHARAWLQDQNTRLEAEITRRLADIRGYMEQLERKANFDDLTSLPNRNLLDDRLAQALVRARKVDDPLAVLTLNVDRLASVNDSLGHSAGDVVLSEVARRLAGTRREFDTLARADGDEFIVVAESVTDEAAVRIARDLLAALEPPFAIDGRQIRLSASIGIAMFPKDGPTAEALLRNSSTAMLKAKSAGGNGFHFYEPAMTARSLERLETEHDLRRAIDAQELVLHYQPQVNLHTGEIVGTEALVRWQHPQRGLVMPADFIPLAEECGLIAPLGEWVLRTACAQNKAWQDAGLPPVTMCVNLSARQFVAQDVVGLAGAILAETGLAPGYLELELTESAVMADADAFIRATRDLKNLAITLSIDDFGTGYSSLSYLRRFAIDRLKIDQSFVRELTHEPNSAAIARAIISLAHTLRLSAIAEGVETAGQLEFLRSQGCDEMQGFYFSKAVPAAEFERLLRDHVRLAIAAAPLAERTLLLVDDEPSILSALKRLFRREGYTVLTAESGMAGLELMASHPVDVVISDGRMPGMTGADFLGRARQLHPDTLRIVLSGYTDLNAVTNAVNRGELFRFLLKPWNDIELLDTVREAFRYSEARRGPRAAAAARDDPA